MYWANEGGTGQVAKIDKAGGSPMILATAQGKVYDVKLDALHVFWTFAQTPACQTGVDRVPKTGGTPEPLYPVCGGAITALGVQGTVLAYVADDGGSVYRGTTEGAGSTKLAGQQGARSLTIDNGTVYWASVPQSAVVRMGAGDPAPVIFAASQAGPYAIAVDDTDVYWTIDGGSIMKLAKNAPATKPNAIVTGQGNPTGIALDATSVYWVNAVGGQVMQAAKDGTSVTALAKGLNEPVAIAVDDTGVYCAEHGGGRILKIPRR